jgi:hypothetical protein
VNSLYALFPLPQDPFEQDGHPDSTDDDANHSSHRFQGVLVRNLLHCIPHQQHPSHQEIGAFGKQRECKQELDEQTHLKFGLEYCPHFVGNLDDFQADVAPGLLLRVEGEGGELVQQALVV